MSLRATASPSAVMNLGPSSSSVTCNSTLAHARYAAALAFERFEHFLLGLFFQGLGMAVRLFQLSRVSMVSSQTQTSNWNLTGLTGVVFPPSMPFGRHYTGYGQFMCYLKEMFE